MDRWSFTPNNDGTFSAYRDRWAGAPPEFVGKLTPVASGYTFDFIVHPIGGSRVCRTSLVYPTRERAAEACRNYEHWNDHSLIPFSAEVCINA